MVIFFQMHFHWSKTSNALLNSWKLPFKIVSAFLDPVQIEIPPKLQIFMGISLMGSQNVCFVLDFYLPVQWCFERSLLAPKSLEMRMVRKIQDLYKKNFIIIYILELMYDMVGEPYPARSWNPSQSVILTFTDFECHLPRWAFLKWISPHTQI